MFIIIMIHIKMVKKSINYQVLIDTVSRTLKVNRRYHLRLRGKGGGGGEEDTLTLCFIQCARKASNLKVKRTNNYGTGSERE